MSSIAASKNGSISDQSDVISPVYSLKIVGVPVEYKENFIFYEMKKCYPSVDYVQSFPYAEDAKYRNIRVDFKSNDDLKNIKESDRITINGKLFKFYHYNHQPREIRTIGERKTSNFDSAVITRDEIQSLLEEQENRFQSMMKDLEMKLVAQIAAIARQNTNDAKSQRLANFIQEFSAAFQKQNQRTAEFQQQIVAAIQRLH